jgi:hypothetical protein
MINILAPGLRYPDPRSDTIVANTHPPGCARATS